MPYVTKRRRLELDVHGVPPANAGDLNYLLTLVILDYVRARGRTYQTINDVVGALEGAKLEFYRRVAAHYEERKIEINGDVYPENLTDLQIDKSGTP